MYKAIVVSLKGVKKHSNADRLLVANVLGNQVIVGLESKDGDLGIYFPTDGQLSEEFAKGNDLIRRKDENGNPAGGMFEEKRKVRTQKFRGEKSEGFWIPIESLIGVVEDSYDVFSLKEGDTFDSIDGIPICNKYITEKTKQSSISKKQKKKKDDPIMFHKHFDTEQFRFYADRIPVGSLINLTSKLHGTSARYTHCLDEVDPTLLDKIKKLFNKNYSRKEWRHILGTRNVVLRDVEKTTGFYGTETFRIEANLPFENKLHKGETIYYEIVGWVSEDTPIMAIQSTEKLSDKSILKKYGKEMIYKYGCPRGTRDIYVYRITHTNEDGVSFDLPWELVKKRCDEFGVKTVPEFTTNFIYDGNVENLKLHIESLTEGEDIIDSSHIREGVCIRVENRQGVQIYKNKSFDFLVMEGVLKDKEDYVDTEESS